MAYAARHPVGSLYADRHNGGNLHSKAGQTKAVARAEAHEDVMNADYKAAITKCDALASDAEDAGVAAAKTKFNK